MQSSWLVAPMGLLLMLGLVIVGGNLFAAGGQFTGNCTSYYGIQGSGLGVTDDHITEWNHNGFHYRVMSFNTGTGVYFGDGVGIGSLGATAWMKSDQCTGGNGLGFGGPNAALGEQVKTDDPVYMWAGQRPVAVQLGAPNHGADNLNGLWAHKDYNYSNPCFSKQPPSTNYPNAGADVCVPIGTGRPPKYSRNWNSPAAAVDDAGWMRIISPRYGNHMIWCDRVPKIPISVGSLPGCVWDSGTPTPFNNDPSTYSGGVQGSSGAGYFFTPNNCHLGDKRVDWGSGPFNDSASPPRLTCWESTTR